MLKDLEKINVMQFESFFSNEETCFQYLAEYKWKNGFVCRKCGNTHYCAGKSPYSRRCTRCKSEESARSHTFFHNCRINIKEAFYIVHKVLHNPNISTYVLADESGHRQMTCWRMKKLVEEEMKTKDLK
jgi:hypothetical protein